MISDKGMELLKEFEAFSAIPYQQTYGNKLDVPTIGYGTTHYPNGIPVTMDDPVITDEYATQLLMDYCNDVDNSINDLITCTLTQNQTDALICFVYNEGITQFRNSTLLKVINIDPNNFTSIETQWMKWVYSQGNFIQGLQNRRTKEFDLYCTL